MSLHRPLNVAMVLLTAVVGLTGLLLGAAPAVAGGPTSVLLTSPTNGRAAGLYFQDREYQVLADLMTYGSVVGDPTPSESGISVNLTWLIHDVMVWRVDRLLIVGTAVYGSREETELPGTAPASPEAGASDPPPAAPQWHVMADGPGLVALTRRHGLLTPSAASIGEPGSSEASGQQSGVESGSPLASAPAPAASPAVGQAQAVAAAPGSPDRSLLSAAEPPGGWGSAWGLLGLIAGSLGTLGVMRRRAGGSA